MNRDVFISYKAEEIEEANWVRSVLENNGISCWMAPACIPGGSSYAVEIPRAIKQAKVFVLILSAKAQSSQWVSKEVDMAITQRKIILPFMLENCALRDDFDFYLTNVQRYTAYENKALAAEKMIKEIKAILGSYEAVPFVGDTRSIDEEKFRKNGKIRILYSWPMIILAFFIFWPLGVILFIKRFVMRKKQVK